jgi:WD40 repeat protein/actin-like ATPase involved in cell morphogenesis
MSIDGGPRLGIDFGTTNTAAVLGGADGPVRPLVFDGSELLPSAVWAGDDGVLLVGRDAEHAARTSPAGFEPHPKRRVDDGTVLLDRREIPVPDLFAAVLARVAAEAGRVAAAPSQVVLTCPAGWGRHRRDLLTEAARRAGLGPVGLVTEPVAAAWHHVRVAGGEVPIGGSVLVYDFGAGTFDASVLRRTAAGFEVLAEEGLPDAGGLDVDAAVVAHLGTRYAPRDAARWARLTRPGTPGDRRAARLLWDDVRAGKEMLSRAASTLIHVPLFDDEALLTREQFEALAGPVVERTVATCRGVLRRAGVEVTGLFLVGGSSRIPLAATMLHREFRIPATVSERPELVVAEGALHALPELPEPDTTEPFRVTVPAVAAETGQPPQRSAPRRRRWPLLAGVGLVVAVVTAAAVLRPWQDRTPATTGTASTPKPSAASSTRQGVRQLVGHEDTVTTVAFSRDGTILATGGNDPAVRLWKVADGTSFTRLTRHFGAIRAIAFTEGSIATLGYDGNLMRWGLDGQHQKTYGSSNVSMLAFTGDGRFLVKGGKDGVNLFDWTTEQTTFLADARTAIQGMAVQGDRLATVVKAPDRKVEVHVYNLTTRTRLTTLDGYNGISAEVAFSGDGSMLAIGDEEGRLDIWDARTGQRRTLTIPDVKLVTVDALAFSPGNAAVAVAEQGRIYLVQAATGTMATVGQHERVELLAFNPKGDLLASAGGVGVPAGKVVNLWEVRTP